MFGDKPFDEPPYFPRSARIKRFAKTHESITFISAYANDELAVLLLVLIFLLFLVRHEFPPLAQLTSMYIQCIYVKLARGQEKSELSECFHAWRRALRTPYDLYDVLAVFDIFPAVSLRALEYLDGYPITGRYRRRRLKSDTRIMRTLFRRATRGEDELFCYAGSKQAPFSPGSVIKPQKAVSYP